MDQYLRQRYNILVMIKLGYRSATKLNIGLQANNVLNAYINTGLYSEYNDCPNKILRKWVFP